MANTPNSEARTQYGQLPSNTIFATRAAAAQGTALLTTFTVSTTDGRLGTALQAYLLEISNTLIAMGVWKGSA